MIYETHYELEEQMGDGSWQRVMQTKEEANYETLQPVCFERIHFAKQHTREHGMSPAHVRVIEVITRRRIVEEGER